MKASLLTWSLFSLLLKPVISTSAGKSGPIPESRVLSRAEKPIALDESPTVFNGIEVPPMKQLTESNFDETIKEGYWYVLGLFCVISIFVIALLDIYTNISV